MKIVYNIFNIFILNIIIIPKNNLYLLVYMVSIINEDYL